MNILVSACLLGISCRYDAKSKTDEKIVALIKNSNFHFIPVCPEILGGLQTPRIPCEIKNQKVVTENDEDKTAQFQKGANEVLRIAKLFDCKIAILKENSPSCGSKKIYDGTFTRTLIDGDGITSKLLKENGIKVFGESEVEKLK